MLAHEAALTSGITPPPVATGQGAVSSGGAAPLPLGAVIGLVVGGTAVLIAIVVGSVLLYKRMRASKQQPLVSASKKKAGTHQHIEDPSASELETAVNDLM